MIISLHSLHSLTLQCLLKGIIKFVWQELCFNTLCESVSFSHCCKQQLPEQPVIGISAGGKPPSCSLRYRNENSYIQATNTLDVHQCFWKLAKAFWRFLSPFLILHTVKMMWGGKSGKIKQKTNKKDKNVLHGFALKVIWDLSSTLSIWEAQRSLGLLNVFLHMTGYLDSPLMNNLWAGASFIVSCL